MRRMRASAVASEAWRNVASGTTRVVVFTLAFIITVGLIALVDVRSVVGLLQGAAQFRGSGAAVHVLQADQGVDGRRCDMIAGTGAITASGAIRQADSLTIWAMPGSQITVVEATPGLVALLPTIAQPAQSDADAPGGIWLSADLAETLGATPGQTPFTSKKSTTRDAFVPSGIRTVNSLKKEAEGKAKAHRVLRVKPSAK